MCTIPTKIVCLLSKNKTTQHMRTLIKHLVLSSLITLTVISCVEEDQNKPSTIYTPGNSEINEPITWNATDSVVIDCILEINSTVTIEPGCVIRMTPNGYLKVGERKNGAIVAVGTAQKPIQFISLSNNDLAAVQKGVWYGIRFGERNIVNTTRLRYCTFSGAGKDETPCIEVYKTELYMESSTIEYCADIAIKAHGAAAGFASFSGNTLRHCDGYLITATTEALNYLDINNTLTPTNDKSIAILGGNINIDCTLTKQNHPYTVLGNLYVDEARLTLESGCTLAFTGRTSLNIGKTYPASLVANGTANNPIYFTSASAPPRAGDWQGLIFHARNISALTSLRNVVIEYAGQSIDSYQGAINTATPIRMENSIIRHSNNYGLFCNVGAGISDFKSNSIESCTRYPISIDVNEAHTIDSTLTFTISDPVYNFINLRGNELKGDYRWKKQRIPYLLSDYLTITNSGQKARLTLSPGTTVAVSQSIIVGANGSLVAEGTAKDSITFTSPREDPEPGDWIGIEFMNTASSGSKLTYCNIEYGGSFADFQIGINTSNVSITRSSIRNSSKHGIYVSYKNPAHVPILSNNSFSGNAGDDIYYEPETEP